MYGVTRKNIHKLPDVTVCSCAHLFEVPGIAAGRPVILRNIKLTWFSVPGWSLEFRLGPSLFGQKVTIYTNVPNEGEAFSRSNYQALAWLNPTASDDSLTCTLKITKSGSYHYYFVCDGKYVKIIGIFTSNLSTELKLQ